MSMWIAANRDPRAFGGPESVGPRHGLDRSLARGRRIHLYLGAPLARFEMPVALEELLARTEGVEFTTEAPCRNVDPSDALAALGRRFR